MKISATILTKNSDKYLQEVLQALHFADEVLLFDNGSTDQTFAIAQQFPNVRVFKGIFTGFGPTHNKASALAKHDWILSIDSDEVVTPELAQELTALQLEPGCVYSVPRRNFYKKKWIKWCGWHPDRQVKLYHRCATKFTEAQVHETIDTSNVQHVHLSAPLIHYSYACAADFLAKMQSYSDLFAKQNQGRKSSSPTKAVLHGFFAFFKSYILKRGFLGGGEGFEISVYNGNTAFYKYLKLYEANAALQTLRCPEEKGSLSKSATETHRKPAGASSCVSTAKK